MENLVCPHCKSEKIITTRGELVEDKIVQECKCNDCNYDFLISHNVQRRK